MPRRSFYLLAAVASLVLLTAPLWLASSKSLTWADESSPVTGQSAETAASVESAAAKATGTEGQKSVSIADPAFEKYVGTRMVLNAWKRMDAELMTDAALQMAEGERILLRSHKLGSAADMLKLAARIAAEKGQKDALARIAAAAKAMKCDDVTAQVAAVGKLGGASRNETPGMTVAVDEVTPAQFAMYRDLVQAMRRAALRGDKASLENAQQNIDKMTRLSDKQRASLKQIATELVAAIPQADTAPNSVATSLAKLQGASRDDADDVLNVIGRVIRTVDRVVNDDFDDSNSGHNHRGHNHRGHNFYDYDEDYDDDGDYYDEEYEYEYEYEYDDEDDSFFGHNRDRNHGHGHRSGVGSRQRSLPTWMIGTWDVQPRRMGGSTQYVIARNGEVTTISTMLVSGGRTRSSSATQTATWDGGQLRIGNEVFNVASSGSRMTLTSRTRKLELARANATIGTGARRPRNSQP